jgi:ABC-type thiamin/hydroxymethylpyrimidine transport system permease subunit
MLDLALWLSFLFSFIMTIFKGEFKNIHYANPINRFGIGTWVAGTSICGIIVFKQFGASYLVKTLAL